MVKKYIISAWRALVKRPGLSFIKIFGLSIGLTGSILIMLWVQNETTYDSYHNSSDRIYRITWDWVSHSNNSEYSPLLLADAAEREITEIEQTARLLTSPTIPIIEIDGNFFAEKNCAFVDEKWFNLFSYKFIEGSPASFLNDPGGLILTKEKAKTYFGNYPAVGKVVKVDSVNYQVRGVISDNPNNSSFQFDLLFPIKARLSNPDLRRRYENWQNAEYITFVRLKSNSDQNKVQSLLANINNKFVSEEKRTPYLVPLKNLHFEKVESSVFKRGDIKPVYIFSTLGLLMLIVACINYVNLTVARASQYANEVSIRKIIGARFQDLFTQFIIEALLLTFIALIMTFGMVWLSLPLFNDITNKHFSLDFGSLYFWRVVSGIFIVAFLMNGIYPAIFLSSFNPLRMLRGTGGLGIKNINFKRVLVVTQFVISMGLMVCVVVMYNQLRYMYSSTLNFGKSSIYSINMPLKLWLDYDDEARQLFLSSFKNELLNRSEIQSASIGNRSVVSIPGPSLGSADWEGRNPNFEPRLSRLNADEDYPKVFDLKVVEGRWFSRNNKSDEHNYILNETAIRDFQIRKPYIGQRFVFNEDTARIIGIVRDFHYQSLHERIGPLIIVNHPGVRFNIFVKAAPNKIPEVTLAAKGVWKKFLGDATLDITFFDDEVNSLYQQDIRTSKIIASLTVVSILIAMLGLIGLVTYAAEQKTKEIGIRKILGASAKNIFGILSREFIYLVLLSMVLAFPIAWWLTNNWLNNFVYKVPIHSWVFLLAGASLLVLVCITISIMTIKVVMNNSLNSLRTE